MNRHLISIVVLFVTSLSLHAQRKTENVILITLDGMRWQEVFTGAERRLITDKAFVDDTARLIKMFWSDDPIKRRELLMPFIWKTIANHGQVYGNRTLNNQVNVSNNQWFSYPGYNEILCGFADNERIHSNDKFDNPNKTVLEFINQQKGFEGKVAAYTSWDVFPFIINTKRSGVPVSNTEVAGSLTPEEKLLNELMREVPNPFGSGIRLDAFTFRLGLEYLKKNKPRAFYFSFDETDDFAHQGKYDLYLESARNTDRFIQKLWTWIQSTPGYKDKTTLIIATDHGRGLMDKNAWRDHGKEVAGADQIWMAFMGPDTPPLGEGKTEGRIYQNQIAKTMAAFLGLSYTNEKPVGEVIHAVLGKD